MKVLVLDDDPIALRLLHHQLSGLGCAEVTLCAQTREAMDLVSAEVDRFELVLCDLQMPDVDGVEFVRHLGSLRFTGSLVLVSGEDPRVMQTVEKLARVLGIAVLGAVQKPAPRSALKQVLDRHAARQAPVHRAVPTQRAAAELAVALRQDELLVHVQPQVRMSDGALVGAEALVRWQHPTAGLVYPDQFIGVAEQHGLIDALTARVLALALQQARGWHDAGLMVDISVNVSMDNLVSLDFPELVVAEVRAAGLPISTLTLEVTESRLMTDMVHALDILTRLRLKRIGLSIDDFGTGYSSLAQLRDVPFDELKLDRSFVHGAQSQRALAAIVGNTLAMAREMGLASVAEGVETRADWAHVRSLGCDVAQGYFIARPMPPADLGTWHARWRQRLVEEGLVDGGA